MHFGSMNSPTNVSKSLEVERGFAHSTFFLMHKSSKNLRVYYFSNSGIISILLNGGLKSIVHSGLFVNFFPVFLSTSSFPSV